MELEEALVVPEEDLLARAEEEALVAARRAVAEAEPERVEALEAAEPVLVATRVVPEVVPRREATEAVPEEVPRRLLRPKLLRRSLATRAEEEAANKLT